MNNEEKILEMLAQMQSDLTAVKATQAAQGEQLAALTEKVNGMDERLTTVADRLLEVDGQVGRALTHQEHDIIPYVKLLDEGHHSIMDKLNDTSRIEAVERDLKLVKTTAKNHAQRIAALEKAK